MTYYNYTAEKMVDIPEKERSVEFILLTAAGQ